MPTRKECANAIRAISVDAIEKAQSGHPGAPLGMAEMGEALWGHFLKHNPADPAWPNRDMFILSNGHASMLLYALLHLTGYALSMEEIKNFRQWMSATPGHPERGRTPGVEMTTGPLGQGIASAVGFALAEALLASEFNRPGYEIVDHYTYAFCGDGCLMEGISHEACGLAGTWKLGKLIVFYDSNGISIDGKTDAWFDEDVAKRFEAYNWQVIGPIDGHDFNSLDRAIKTARQEDARPTLIICRTHIGFGSPKEDSASSHGSPLGSDAIRETRRKLQWDYPPFEIPREIYEAWDAREKGKKEQQEWENLFAAYARAYPDLAAAYKRRVACELPKDWKEFSKKFLSDAVMTGREAATRVSSKECLEKLVPELPQLIGGSADLSSSVGTQTGSSVPLQVSQKRGNYIYYGVREFGMGAIMNGLAMHGGFIPYAGTFLSFSDQAKNAIRLSCLMRLQVIWVLTHDTIGVGEDGPTHQPVEQLSSLRMMPNMHVWRPCDMAETAYSWISAIENPVAPTCLVLSRQKLPQFERTPDQEKAIARGGYILRGDDQLPELIFIASGSEVALAVKAWEILAKQGISTRVVSMPCCEIFDIQPETWKEKVLPKSVRKRIAIEASSAQWWERYTGLDGKVIGMTTFGSSAPGPELLKKFGFTVDNVVKTALVLLEKNN